VRQRKFVGGFRRIAPSPPSSLSILPARIRPLLLVRHSASRFSTRAKAKECLNFHPSFVVELSAISFPLFS